MSIHDRDCLPPELLAAYADGELPPAEVRRVEAWLARHPEAQADVEAQRRLARLLDETTAPLPADEQWADVLARVESELALPRARSRRLLIALAAIAAAAVVLLALALRHPPAGSRTPNDGPAEEPWPVASADDVQILSMDGRDRGTLVVGEPPVNESLELMAEDEIVVSDVQPDRHGRRPQLYVSEDSRIPMMIMPPSRDAEEDP